MRVGFIGVGNMASAMLHGMLASGRITPGSLYAFDVNRQAAESLRSSVGLQVCGSMEALAASADTIFLAVKPQVMQQVLRELSPFVAGGKKLLVSIAAGLSLDTLQGWLESDDVPLIRVMPNVNMLVGSSMSAVCANAQVGREQEEAILQLLRSVGAAIPLPEKDFSIFTALAGCGPAYVYLFIDTLSRAGVKYGLPKALATEIAAQTVLGSGKMVQESGRSEWELIDQVCSPGGTTVAGLLELQNNAFQSSVIRGIDAAVQRDVEMQDSASA